MDVTWGRLRASLEVTLKRVCFAMIPNTTHRFYGNLPQIHNDITSNLEVGQSATTDNNAVDISIWEMSLIATAQDDHKSQQSTYIYYM